MKFSLLLAFLVAAIGLSTHAQTRDTAYSIQAEIQPAFPGGAMSFKRYLDRNLRYPYDAVWKGIPDTVVVQFIVARDGTISNIEAISGPATGGFREEAVRVIKKSGKWVPAIVDGRQTSCAAKQPIIFVKQEE